MITRTSLELENLNNSLGGWRDDEWVERPEGSLRLTTYSNQRLFSDDHAVFKEPLCHRSDGRLVPARRAALAGQPPGIAVLTQMKDKGEWTAPRKIYYDVVFKKMQFENTQGRGKNNPFFHLLSVSLPFLYLSIQQGWERSRVAEKERESGAMFKVLVSQINFMLTDGLFHWKRCSLPGVCGWVWASATIKTIVAFV